MSSGDSACGGDALQSRAMKRFAASADLEAVRFGAGGYLMMALSACVLLASMGASGLLAIAWVTLQGWRAPYKLPGRRVLVLGMQLDPAGEPGRAYRARLNRAYSLWTADPDREIILLGGRTRPGCASEAFTGACYLQTSGVPAAQIRLEDRSRHTLESLSLYRAEFARSAEPPLLVTSRFHLARASLLANGLG